MLEFLMLEEKEFKFKCLKCGRCCQDKNTIVNLNYIDIYRMIKVLNLNLDELLDIASFYVIKNDVRSNILEKMVISPIITEKGPAFLALRKNENGECIFHNPKNKKCRIYQIRPDFCRTFPFTFVQTYKTTNQLDDNDIEVLHAKGGLLFCPGIKGKAPEINIDRLKKLGMEVLQDLIINERIIKRWNDAVKNEKITPSARGYLKYLLEIFRELEHQD